MARRDPSDGFVAAGFFVVRTPLLSWQELDEWTGRLAVRDQQAADAGLDSALAEDRDRLRRGLDSILRRPEVREALYLASPSLVESLGTPARAPDDRKRLRAERAVVRYLVRMVTRPTPFGIFSGCSFGTLTADRQPTAVELAPRSCYLRRTRLDMDYLSALCEQLASRPGIRQTILHRPNTSLYQTADRLYYVHAEEGNLRAYRLTAVDPNDAILDTLARAEEGATVGELASALVESDPEGDIGHDDAKAFVEELIETQLLLPDLAPTLTSGDALGDLLDHLEGCVEAATASVRLRHAEQSLHQLDRGIGQPVEHYHRVTQELATELPTRVDPGRLFQVDLFKPTVASRIGREVIGELERGVELLRHLDPPVDRPSLARFRDDFRNRYGDRREIPLAEVMDPETGIGFDPVSGPLEDSSPLLQGLAFAFAGRAPAHAWTRWHSHLLSRLHRVLAHGWDELRLEADDLENGATPAPMPDSFHVMAEVAAASPAALVEGAFRVLLRHASGPSGARLLGRFCHLDGDLCEAVSAHLRREEDRRPDVVFAEIVHLPQGRIGNILSRPTLRLHEIPFLGRSSVDRSGQIPIQDLRVSVLGDRIVLTSERLGKEVAPRLTSAHNYAGRGLKLYHFLCVLQAQGTVEGLRWDWGPLGEAPFLPRVTYGRLVLARAQWRLDRSELADLTSQEGGALIRAARELRRRRRLPRRAILADGDHELLVDFENVLVLEAFVDVLGGRRSATLLELFPGPAELWVRGPEGNFFHELVVPFERPGSATLREPSPPDRVPSAAPTPELPTTVLLPPGSDWLYFKLYCGPATADRVLRELVAPEARQASGSGTADHWHFIRYLDPEWHLRVRFHGAPEALCHRLLPRLLERLGRWIADGRIWRLQIDTYQPELTRYGGRRRLAVVERIFHLDSEAVISLLELLEEGGSADDRWRLALLGADRLLADLDLAVERRLELVRGLRERFTEEHGADLRLKRQLGDRYRKERETIEDLLGGPRPANAILAAGAAVFARRSAALSPFVGDLLRSEGSARNRRSIETLAADLMHLHVNRLIRSEARAHELVLYELLYRYYNARIRAAD